MSALERAQAVLLAQTPDAKVHAARELALAWESNKTVSTLKRGLGDRPNRPDKPEMVDPRTIPRKGLGKVEGRIALLHAVAHIEFNAIDLAADMICRFSTDDLIKNHMKEEFVSDWILVCADEARHFELVNTRLLQLGSFYGDQPAHDGLWEAALSTRHDVTARLAIAPMVLEARGLDVTPAMIKKLKQVKDVKSADILQIIYDDEIGHVAIGTKWFNAICKNLGRQPEAAFHALVKTHFSGKLKPPFNTEGRALAGLTSEFYAPLV